MKLLNRLRAMAKHGVTKEEDMPTYQYQRMPTSLQQIEECIKDAQDAGNWFALSVYQTTYFQMTGKYFVRGEEKK